MSADLLKKAAQGYLLRYGYSSQLEVGLCTGGKLRADLLAINTKCKLVLCEIKSSLRDLTSDRKWQKYVDYADRAYFVVSADTFDRISKERLREIKDVGFGVLVLCPKSGYLRCRISAKTLSLPNKTRRNLMMRLAWRGGVSRRNSRRTRIYLTR